MTEPALTLETLKPGERAKIVEILGDEPLRARMFALGLRNGREVAVIRRTRLGGTLQVRVGSTDLIIRPTEARLVRLAMQAQ